MIDRSFITTQIVYIEFICRSMLSMMMLIILVLTTPKFIDRLNESYVLGISLTLILSFVTLVWTILPILKYHSER